MVVVMVEDVTVDVTFRRPTITSNGHHGQPALVPACFSTARWLSPDCLTGWTVGHPFIPITRTPSSLVLFPISFGPWSSFTLSSNHHQQNFNSSDHIDSFLHRAYNRLSDIF